MQIHGRLAVDGKTRHVWTSSDPRECAVVLARFKLIDIVKHFPCLLQSQAKEHIIGQWISKKAAIEACEEDTCSAAACAALEANGECASALERMCGEKRLRGSGHGGCETGARVPSCGP